MSLNSSCLFVEQVNEINNNVKPNLANSIHSSTQSNKVTNLVELNQNDVTYSEKLETFEADAACLLVDLLLQNNTESKQEQIESNITDSHDIANRSEQTSSQQRTNAKNSSEFNTFTGFQPSEESHFYQHPNQATKSSEVFIEGSSRQTNEEIPYYRLRTESLNTYKNSHWIKAPSKFLLDQQLTNDQIKLTLDYFILSGHRVSQMTKTYHDIEAVTKLLDEKEKDLELAAQIGKQLLERDQQLESKIEILEVELDRTTDMVNQLRHDIVLKDNLLKSFIEFESEAFTDEQVYRDPMVKRAYGDATASNEQVKDCKRRIRDLEYENQMLKSRNEAYESEDFVHSSSFGKANVKSSHENCLKEIESAQKNLSQVKEELESKTNECLNQQEEIQSLFSQIFVLQLKVKDLTAENSDLQSFYDSTTSELIDQLNELKEKYNECLLILAKTQEELSVMRRKSNGSTSKVNKHQQTQAAQQQQHMRSISTSTSISSNVNQLLTSDTYMSYDDHDEQQQDELVNESINSNASISNSSKFLHFFPNNQNRNESLATEMFQSLARDYRFTNSNLMQQVYTSSDMVRKVKLKLIKQLPGSCMTQTDQLLTDSEMESYDHLQQRNTFNTKFNNCPTPDSIFSTGSASIYSASLHHLLAEGYSQNSTSNFFMLPDKLQIVKPIEGSQTLQHWQQLARPNLACLFEERPGIAVKENVHEWHEQSTRLGSRINMAKSNMKFEEENEDEEIDYDFGVNESLDFDCDDADIELSYINEKRHDSHAEQSTRSPKKENYRVFSPSKLELLNKLLENDESPVIHNLIPANSNSQNKLVDFFSSYFRSANSYEKSEKSQEMEKETNIGSRKERAEYDDPETPPSSPINVQIDSESSSNLFYDVFESAKVRCRKTFVDSFFSSYFSMDEARVKKDAPTPPGTPFNELSDEVFEQLDHKKEEKPTCSTLSTNNIFEQILNKLNFFSFKSFNSEPDKMEHLLIKPSPCYAVIPIDTDQPEEDIDDQIRKEEDLKEEKCSTPPPSPCRLSPHLYSGDPDGNGDLSNEYQSILEKSAFVKVTTLNPFINKSIDLASLLGCLSSLKRNQRFCK